MLLAREREEVVEYGKKLIKNKLTTGTGGNLSIFNRDKGLVAISPSGIDYFETRIEDVVVVDLKGQVVDGNKKPSSELMLHLIIYRNREDINAVVHTHSIYATSVACMNLDLPPVHYMIAVAGENVRCAKYATFGSEELAINAYEAMKDRNAVLLANHGLLAGGSRIQQAFKIAEDIEFVAEIFTRTKSMGNPVILPEDEMKRMKGKFQEYGQKK